WRCISVLARLRRAGMTRVAAYSSKLLRNVPRWRRSKASTAGSGERPANALSITLRETPAAAAARDMPAGEVAESPPHCVALAALANDSAHARIVKSRNILPLECSFLDHRTGARQGQTILLAPVAGLEPAAPRLTAESIRPGRLTGMTGGKA